MPRFETSKQRWLLQVRRGELRLINDLGELVRLVLERRVDRQALLYRIDGEPHAIGDLPELAELFDSQATPPPLAGSDAVRSTEGEHSFADDEVPYLDSISPLGSTEDAFGAEYDVVPRRRWPAVLTSAAGVALIAAGVYIA